MNKMNDQQRKLGDGSHAYAGLDRAFHEKARLGIMTCIASQPDDLSFNDLKRLCDLSDGNLNRHLEVLQEAGAIQLNRTGAGRTARTTVRITKQGRKDFHAYLAELERVVKDAAKAMKRTDHDPKRTRTLGLSE